jgi:NADH:ubiquinone oxidoreductase subunit C
MFGIRFVDRPDIKRLLLYEEFKGHPLRKDYPITKRQPLIGPQAGEPRGNPSFNHFEPTIKFE